jgi:hypothetical protein
MALRGDDFIGVRGAPQALADNLQAASADRTHTVIHLRIEDHQEFIKLSYEGALALGDA